MDAEPDVACEVAVGGAHLAAFEKEGTIHHGGVGASGSYFVVGHVLSVELIGHTLFAPDRVSLPFDLQLKLEGRFSYLVHPYVTLGPTLVADVHHGEATLWPGISSAGGFDFWFHERGGWMVELNGNLILATHVRPELGMFTGPVTRF